MSTELKAIETRYKGFHFRSRTEARFAVFCDACGITWRYEEEGFDLGEEGCYLPDFYMPLIGCWVEIKPTSVDSSETLKWKALVKKSARSLVVFNGDYERPKVWLMSFGEIMEYTASRDSADWTMTTLIAWLHGNLRARCDAIDAAKSARFEHGECGPT